MANDTGQRRFIAPNYHVNVGSIVFAGGCIDKIARSKDYYEILLNERQEQPACLRYWGLEDIVDSTTVKDSFKIYKQATSESKLLSVQYKIIRKVISTNTKQKGWKIRNKELCSYCNESIDTLIHYFWDCKLATQVMGKY